jgi:hypothetical protein
MIASSVLPHFWAEIVSNVTYLINIQHSLPCQGGIHFERLYGKTPDYSSLHLLGCVCYVLLAPHERTKLITQSVEYVFLGYIVVGIRLLVRCGRHEMLSLMSLVLSIRVPPLMLLLHLWLILCLSYFFLVLLLLCLFLARFYRPLCLPLSLLLWFQTTW